MTICFFLHSGKTFTFKDVDDLIEGLQNTVKSHIDLNKLSGGRIGIKVVDEIPNEPLL